MTKYEKLYREIILNGKKVGIRFDDLKSLVEYLGFNLITVRGDHFKYTMDGIPEIINIQPDKKNHKDAKAVEVAEIQKLVKKYKLGGGDNE